MILHNKLFQKLTNILFDGISLYNVEKRIYVSIQSAKSLHVPVNCSSAILTIRCVEVVDIVIENVSCRNYYLSAAVINYRYFSITSRKLQKLRTCNNTYRLEAISDSWMVIYMVEVLGHSYHPTTE